MIPSTWFRRLILTLFLMEVMGGMMWLGAEFMQPASQSKTFAQTVAGIVFLLGFYAGGPLTARYLAPRPSADRQAWDRVERAAARAGAKLPIFLYDHTVQSADTVGLLPRHARVYVTTGLVSAVSDDALAGILAHENTHAREHHILILFLYACAWAVLLHQIPDRGGSSFAITIVAFMFLRRYLEYRADAGAARAVGVGTTVEALTALDRLYPRQWWSRFFVFAAPHPLMAWRLDAVTGAPRRLF